jgi:hypothetical protein
VIYSMTSTNPSDAEIFLRTEPALPSAGVEAGRAWGQKYLQIAIILLVLNAVSAMLFIALVNRPVFDDPNNFPDVHRYASEGVSVDTIRHHINPTGPISFIWMAAAIRALGGDGLREARLAILLSWMLLGAGIIIGARYSNFPELWYAALMVTLIFPHTLTATATVLTEGPAMLFAVLGVLAWVESVARPAVTLRTVTLSLLGGLSIGVAVTSRQYYLSLLPAAALFALYQWRESVFVRKPVWIMSVILSLAAAALPVFLLVLVWKGLSSPGMVSGRSYATWKSTVGPNLFRPIVAFFYTALYFVPLTFPAALRLPRMRRGRALLVSLIAGIGAMFLTSYLLQPGPLQSLVRAAGRSTRGQSIFFGLIVGFVTYNGVAFGCLIWGRRGVLLSCPPVIFALLAVAFFIVEQAGVGGNIPFYELYVLQMAPFLGIIVFRLLPRLTLPRVTVLVCLWVMSNGLLWRYALSG